MRRGEAVNCVRLNGGPRHGETVQFAVPPRPGQRLLMRGEARDDIAEYRLTSPISADYDPPPPQARGRRGPVR